MLRFRPGIAFAFACGGFVFGIAFASFGLSWWFGVVLCVVVCVSVVWRGGAYGRSIFSKNIKNATPLLPPHATPFPPHATPLPRPRHVVHLLFLALCFSFLGFWRYGTVQPSVRSVLHVADGAKHVLEGTVVRIAERDAYTQLTIDHVAVDGIAHEDRVLVRTTLFSSVTPGERVSVSCPLQRPEAFDDFAYDRYLAAKDIVATCATFDSPFVLGESTHVWIRILSGIDVVHDFFVTAIDAVLPDPHAQLLAGLLLGDDAFSSPWKERFLRTGTSHIVAASGSNVALTVSLLLALLFGAGVHRKYATIFVLFGIGIFVLLAGAESAVVRAGIMASLVVLARVSGRASSVRNVLLCTVCIMLFIEPRILRDDVGFQLSVLSTVGLIFWAKLFAKRVTFIPETFGLREGFATTLAATLATLPVTVFGMGQVSLVGPLANLLVLPLLTFAMAFGAVATVLGMISPVFGRFVAFPAWWILDTVLMILRELSALSFVFVELSWMGVLWVVGIGGVVFVMTCVIQIYRLRSTYPEGVSHRPSVCWRAGRIFRARDKTEKEKIQNTSFLVSYIFLSLFLLSFFQHVFRDGWFSPYVRVWVFDVGQGDAIFVDTAQKDIVIDAGANTLLSEKLGTILPWTDRSLDYAFATHPDADHVTGFAQLFTKYDVDMLGESGQGCDTLFCMPFANASLPRTLLSQGDVFTLAPDVTLHILWPRETYFGDRLPDANAASLVMLLHTPSGSMLFMGDADADAEVAILPFIEHVDVLKLGHHGSDSSTSYALLEKTMPVFGIVSAGEENRYGHPHDDVLDRLAHVGVTVVRTDTQGDIRVVFGKRGVEVRVFRL